MDGVRETTVSLVASPTAVLDFEAFADGLDFLGGRERGRVKLAGEEILDNLIHHASPLGEGRITIRAARRKSGIVLAFFFRSPAFGCFAEDCGDAEPLFDPEHHRWRGIGLRMCNNLSRSITMRPGTVLDRIFLSFDLEPEELSPLSRSPAK